jgi:hypothetical protein
MKLSMSPIMDCWSEKKFSVEEFLSDLCL